MPVTGTEPTYVFEDDLSPAQAKRYLALPFGLPPGTGRLRIDLVYGPLHVAGCDEHVKNLICITLFDPLGFRGSLHSSTTHKVVEIGPLGATPGFRPGPLPAGRWTLELGTFAVLPGPPCSYRVELRLEAGGGETVAAPAWRPHPALGGPGWYRGDLHTHTVHSDGSVTVAQLVRLAHQEGLDFIALTDHNAVAGLADPALNGLAVIPGMELTTYYGHAVALGIADWVDWRTGRVGRSMAMAAADVHARGGLLAIAHPAALGDPVCTGCSWLYTDQMPGALDAVEVWNGPWFGLESSNPNALYIWHQWLRAGHRVHATAGSDLHGPNGYARRPGWNVVYARELSAAGLLEGLADGHVMLSAGPRLYLEATLHDGRTAIMGDVVPAADVAVLSLRCEGAPPQARLQWLAGGECIAEWRAAEAPRHMPLPSGAGALLAELWAPDGELLALTNPIYLR